jgi:predicted RNA methylase
MSTSDKWSGGVVGERSSDGLGVLGSEVGVNSTIDEFLQASDGTTLQAALTFDGDVTWLPVKDPLGTAYDVMARSQMSSMLKDSARVEGYALAVAAAVTAATRTLRRPPRVLDIGAGGGLLSVLASRAGASHVDAFEQWPIMADIAKCVTATEKERNITIHSMHSSSAQIDVAGAAAGIAGAMTAPADVLISEIVDSGLLGEGVLPALRDAFKRGIVSRDAVTVPCRAVIRAVLVRSPITRSLQDTSILLRESPTSRLHFGREDWSPSCEATSKSLPVAEHAFEWTPVSEEFDAFSVNLSANAFTTTSSTDDDDKTKVDVIHQVRALPGAGNANGVLFWWEMILWEDKDEGLGGGGGGKRITVSTTPGGGAAAAGGGHWAQMLFPLPASINPSSLLSTFTVVAGRNDYHIWFFVGEGSARVWPSKRARNLALKKIAKNSDVHDSSDVDGSASSYLIAEPQSCVCGLHRLLPPERRWALRETSVGSLLPTIRSSLDHAITSLVKQRIKEHAEALSDAGMTLANGGIPHIRLLDCSESPFLALLAASSPSIMPGDVVTSTIFALQSSDTWTEHMRALITASPDVYKNIRLVNVQTATQVNPINLCQAEKDEEEEDEEEKDDDDGDDADIEMEQQVEATSSSSTTFDDGILAELTGGSSGSGQVQEKSEENANFSAQPILDGLIADPLSWSSFHGSPLWAAAAWSRRVRALSRFTAPGAIVLPARATVFAAPFCAPALHGSFGPVTSPAGVDHSAYNTAVGARWASHSLSLPLWHFDTQVDFNSAVSLGHVDFTLDPIFNNGWSFLGGVNSHAIVIWIDWNWGSEKDVVSTGPRVDGGAGPYRQAVILLESEAPNGIEARLIKDQTTGEWKVEAQARG